MENRKSSSSVSRRKSSIDKSNMKSLDSHDKSQDRSKRRSTQRKKISFVDVESTDHLQDSSRGTDFNRSRKPSVVAPPPDKRPDWYEDLTEEQVNMFKEIFEMLDCDGGGSIDADELYVMLKDLDIEVTREEIKAVLQDLDADGNGEIDFDEFLYCMANTMGQETEAGQEDNGIYSKRQTLFFTAITRFAIKNSLGEIDRYYAHKQRQAPHVISCYTAGVRLIGLNDRQLEQEIRRMQKAARNHKSPYAKPLPFLLKDTNTKKLPNKKKKKKKVPLLETKPENNITTIRIPEESGDDQGEIEPDITESRQRDIKEIIHRTSSNPGTAQSRSSESRRSAITPEELEVIKLLHEMAEKGNVVARLPGIHLVPQIRNKLVTGETLCSSVRKRRRTLMDNNNGKLNGENGHGHRLSKTGSGDLGMSAQRGNHRGVRGWVIPRIEVEKAPLPVIKLSDGNVEKKFTIEDINDIRKWVSEAMGEYYTSLKKAHVKSAYSHWDKLHTDQIKSKRLRELFRKVYRAYSPHEEGEVFAIAPWIPGRWYFQHKSSRDSPAVQAHRIGYCYSAPPYEMKQCGFVKPQKKRNQGSAPSGGKLVAPSVTPVVSSRPSSRMGTAV